MNSTVLQDLDFNGLFTKPRLLMKDENEKCVSCIKQGMKFCAYAQGANKCCNVTDFSTHCQYNCSNLLISNSIYSQYRVCPKREIACGNNFINASVEDQFMTSSLGYYRGNITCFYHIHNPYPLNPLYFTIYRKTNHSEIGIYFRQENIDGTREYSTIVYEFPPRNIYQGLASQQIEEGEPFRNNTDMMKRYTFNYVSQLNIVAIGISDDSEFDFGIRVSVYSVQAWDRIYWWSYVGVGGFLVSVCLYVIIEKCVRELNKRSHVAMEDEQEEKEQQDLQESSPEQQNQQYSQDQQKQYQL